MTRRFRLGTRIHAGVGALAETAGIFAAEGIDRVFVVADRGVAEIGALDRIIERAGVGNLVVGTALADVNPAPASVVNAAEAARRGRAQGVLGIGGGSGLGAAKAVALLLGSNTPLSDLEGTDRADLPPVPTIAVPTTAGSGSEVSNALVLHEPGVVREIVIRGEGYEPTAAVLDASVLRGLPRSPLVFAALDALTHALEALWSRGRSVFTDACALHAGTEILALLPDAVAGCEDGRNADGDNDEVLQCLLEASSLANIACGNSGLALVHALSSSPAIDVPHGRQNGVLLPHVARLNRSALEATGRTLADGLGELYERIGFTARFEPGEAFAAPMIEASRGHVFRENNAVEATDDELRRLLDEAGASAGTSAGAERSAT